MDFGEVSEVY